MKQCNILILDNPTALDGKSHQCTNKGTKAVPNYFNAGVRPDRNYYICRECLPKWLRNHRQDLVDCN